MVSLVSQHSLEGEHRLWVAQATFDWVGWQHVRALACLLLACCVRTGEGARSSTMPLSCTGAVASSRRVATQPRISQAWVHTARGWRRPLSTGSAGSTCGRLRICCSLAVCGRGRAHARALCPSHAPAQSRPAVVSQHSLESVRFWKHDFKNKHVWAEALKRVSDEPMLLEYRKLTRPVATLVSNFMLCHMLILYPFPPESSSGVTLLGRCGAGWACYYYVPSCAVAGLRIMMRSICSPLESAQNNVSK